MSISALCKVCCDKGCHKMSHAVEMRNITKIFGQYKANDNVSFTLRKGEIHALLGENGAGKSTLMNILFGMHQPDQGSIWIQGVEQRIASPKAANSLKIGMVHQHFQLIDNFTVLQNIVLGEEPKKRGGRVDYKVAREKIESLIRQYGLKVDIDKHISSITVGQQQRVEILKMLYRESEILIFDEPTAVLTPNEIDELIVIMKGLKAQGKSIIIITHKLKEIKQVADRCTILRTGKYIKTVEVADTTEAEMAEEMVGRQVTFKVDKSEANPEKPMLQVEDLTVRDERYGDMVKQVSFEVRAGEIVGIAGIDGNGQSELIEGITGLRELTCGKVVLDGVDITSLSIRRKTEAGIGHIPEDRQKHGLVLSSTLEDNLMLQEYYKAPFSRGLFLNRSYIATNAEQLIKKFDIRSSLGAKTSAGGMSGGNQQKVIVAREITREPKLLIAVQPTRGVDVGAIEFIHSELVKERDRGSAVLLVSFELDEILSVSDRVLVMYGGEIVADLHTSETDEREIGRYMAGVKKETMR